MGRAVSEYGSDCKAVPFVELTVAHASVLTILAISFERYYAICEPLKAGYVCTKARATFLCLLAWVMAALCTSPMIWVSQYREMKVNGTDLVANLEDQEAHEQIAVCLTQANTTATTAFFLLLVIFFFLVPLLLLLVLYSLIVRHLIRDTSTTSSTSDAYYARARRQVVLMLLTVVVSFFVCLSPYRILIFYIVLAPAEHIASIDHDTFFGLLNFSRIMFYLNSAVNPILYNLMSSRFRKGFLRLCGLRPSRRSQIGTFRSTITGARRTTNTEQQENFL
ncbi:hypothetical protein KM043_017314 [Ampulex compressa]|nr:hypothetical protein KM043_017314 [Ampulex compressa]